MCFCWWISGSVFEDVFRAACTTHFSAWFSIRFFNMFLLVDFGHCFRGCFWWCSHHSFFGVVFQYDFLMCFCYCISGNAFEVVFGGACTIDFSVWFFNAFFNVFLLVHFGQCF
jgi:hypothetical protein